MMRAIPQIAVEFVAQREGLRTIAYRDSAGVPTLGYGHTESVKMGDRCTKAQALAWLAEDLKIARNRLYGVLKAAVIDMLTEYQWAALLSFVFNVGANPSWQIWKRLNAKQFDAVPAELMRFVNAGGKKILGLVNRRAEEVKLWSTDEPGSTAEAVSSATTRSTPTPPTPIPVKSVEQSKTFWAGATVTAGGVIAGAQQVQAIAMPQASNSEWVGKLAAFAAFVIVAGGIAVMVFRWLDSRSKHV